MENKKIKLVNSFSELAITFEQTPKRIRFEPNEFKLKELVSEESFEKLFDMINLLSDSRQKLHEFANIIEGFNQCIVIITEKITVGRKILDLL